MTKYKIIKLQAKDLKYKNINVKQIIKNFNKTGVIVVENLLNKQKCNFFINLLEKSYSKYKNLYFANKLKKIATHSQSYNAKTVSNLHNKNIKFLKFLDHPTILPLVTSFLQQGSHMESDRIICQSFVARSPTGKAKSQQLHNDARMIGLRFPIVIQVMWALDNFTQNNGSTRFVLGSHKFMKFPKNGKTYKDEVIIEIPSGSAIIFNGAVWHGSSKIKNVSSRRWGVVCRYARWFLKPSFNFQENTPKNIYNKMNKTQRDLLGFSYNTPKDEFSSDRTTQRKYSKPLNYTLPV